MLKKTALLPVLCALSVIASPALSGAAKAGAAKSVTALEAELKAACGEAADLLAEARENSRALRGSIAKAKTEMLKNYGRKALAVSDLGVLRGALQLYYCDTQGSYPEKLESLVPRYLPELPELQLPGYPRTRKVFTVTTVDRKNSPLKESGGWIYIFDPSSKMHGTVLIDAGLKYKGKALYLY